MAATRKALFGETPGAVAALPGTYGEAPGRFRLPDATRLGRVSLQVADLSRSIEFYQGVLGFREVERGDSSSVLAARGDDTPLVELHEHPGAKSPSRRGRLGLFHFAILLPDRSSLGSFAQHLADIGAYAGSSDHRVSEAFYLQDPDSRRERRSVTCIFTSAISRQHLRSSQRRLDSTAWCGITPALSSLAPADTIITSARIRGLVPRQHRPCLTTQGSSSGRFSFRTKRVSTQWQRL
jgi:catechol 2,3-dioxygenase-like lactoylglutathione lyase family enzyme